jgi:hypothetical protein
MENETSMKIETLNLEQTQDLEQLRTAAKYWKAKHQRDLATAEEALRERKLPVKIEDIKEEWKRKM